MTVSEIESLQNEINATISQDLRDAILANAKNKTVPPSPIPQPAGPRFASPSASLSQYTLSETQKELHDNYFAEEHPTPSSLHFLREITEAESKASPYSVLAESISPSHIRFNFDGQLLLPEEAISLSSYIGLHHHADAPDAAGYTIPELALLGRSVMPGQRTIAIQTLGRIIDRLKTYGETRHIWELLEAERVVDVMARAANERTERNVTVRMAAEKALLHWVNAGGPKMAEDIQREQRTKSGR